MADALFDDIQLVRVLDAWQQDGRTEYADGEQLMRELGGNTSDEAERAGFTRLLGVLAEDKILAYDQRWPPMRIEPPKPHEYQFLESLKNFRLLPNGIDRARGRVVAVAAPEPDVDDGRRLSVRVLDKSAQQIASQFSGGELPTFLRDAGIPEEHVPPFEGTEWRYLSETLQALWEREMPGRRIVRRFLGAWLDDELEVGPDLKAREDILGDLARQGWHVRTGELVVGDREKRPRPTADAEKPIAADPAHAAVDGPVPRERRLAE